MNKATKFCEISVHTLSGVRLRGRFHMDASLSSSIRPYDAIRENTGQYILLSHATIHENGESHDVGTVMVRADGIAYIELGSKGWRTPSPHPR
jgi:hypothetical protein